MRKVVPFANSSGTDRCAAPGFWKWIAPIIGAVMKFLITMAQDEDGMFVAECPAIPGCVSQGRTAEEAERNIQDAIQECLAVRVELGLPLTVTVREVEVPV